MAILFDMVEGNNNLREMHLSPLSIQMHITSGKQYTTIKKERHSEERHNNWALPSTQRFS